MLKQIADRQQEVARLCQQYRVRRLAVFGSALREDFDPERSDIDFLVEFEESPNSYFELWEELTKLFERQVDLVALKAIKNPYFLRSVERSQETLYAS